MADTDDRNQDASDPDRDVDRDRDGMEGIQRRGEGIPGSDPEQVDEDIPGSGDVNEDDDSAE
jgi:hypothetical protein